MHIIADAPGRAGIVGNPTAGYGGAVISCSVAARARVELITGGDALTVTIAGRQQRFTGRPDEFALRDDYFDCVRAVIQFLRLYDLKAEITTATDIPVQAGLAGSTALLTALVAAVHAALGRTMTPYHLAETVRIIELNYLKIQCGYQDQYMTVFGGLNYMDFRQKEHYRSFRQEVFATIESLNAHVADLPFILAHTGVKRTSGVILKPIRDRWLEGDAKVHKGYRRIAELALQGKRAFIEGDWRRLAQLMNENHRIQQHLGASSEANDKLIDAARRAGAMAAKLAGAGGGGTIIALAPSNADRVTEALRADGAAEFIALETGAGVRVRTDDASD